MQDVLRTRRRGPQSAGQYGEEGCVVVEWDGKGKRRLEEAGLRWSQFPNGWQCAGPSPIIHLHPSELFGRGSSLAGLHAGVLASHDSDGGHDMCWRAISCHISPCVKPTRAGEWRGRPKLQHAGLVEYLMLASWQREALGGADVQTCRRGCAEPSQAHTHTAAAVRL
jgi:hypothetical protein